MQEIEPNLSIKMRDRFTGNVATLKRALQQQVRLLGTRIVYFLTAWSNILFYLGRVHTYFLLLLTFFFNLYLAILPFSISSHVYI
jgi:hypothetical protein